jgi:hypothetical protein
LEHLSTDYVTNVIKEIRRVSKKALITTNSNSNNKTLNPNGKNSRGINLEVGEYFEILGVPKSKHWDSIGEQGNSSSNLNLYEFKNNI